MTDDVRNRYLTLFNRQNHLIKEWKKHQLRTVHQETAREFVFESLDENSVSKTHSLLIETCTISESIVNTEKSIPHVTFYEYCV